MRKEVKRFIINISICFLLAAAIILPAIFAQSVPTASIDEPMGGVSPNVSHMLDDGVTGLEISEDIVGMSERDRDKNDDNGEETNAEEKNETENAQIENEKFPSDNLVPGTVPAQNEFYNKTDTVYFTTSIKDGSTVYKRDYSFTIKHRVSSLKVKEVFVYVNGELQPQFNGKVLLNEGRNSIRIVVSYTDAEGKIISAFKKYTLYVEIGTIVIETDLTDKTVNSAEFSFKADAWFGGKKVNVAVTHNGSKITSSDGEFYVTLLEGENEFKLTAFSGDNKRSDIYIVKYEKEEFKIITSLKNETVNSEDLNFTASISGGSAKAKLTVVCNGETAKGTEGAYGLKLKIGKNVIRLKAVDGSRRIDESYTVQYVPLATEETRPIIRYINLSEGQTIAGTSYTLDVDPVDYRGNRIYYDGISVVLNGTQLTYQWASEYTSYLLNLTGGANTIALRITDRDGRYSDYSYTFYCNAVSDGDPIGTVTMSVHAGTVGLGYLVSPESVTIYQGESAVDAVTRMLEDHGFTYNHTGTSEIGFYLSRISKPGMCSGVSIPQDLVEAIEADGLEWKEQRFQDSLGEYDYCQGSGWMYTINGSYVNYSLSDCNLKDGDVVRIRYTLAYGKDIGGYSSTGGSGFNYGKEW